MTDDLPDEWRAYAWWRDWIDAWRLVGAAVGQWSTLYAPFMAVRE